MTTSKIDELYNDLAGQIVALIETNEHSSLQQRWTSLGDPLNPINPTTGKTYNGLNALILACHALVAMDQSKPVPTDWATYRQWEEEGHQVAKGSKGIQVRRPFITKDKETGEVEVKGYRTYWVFSGQQLTEPHQTNRPNSEEPRVTTSDLHRAAEAMGVKLTHGGNRAYYAPAKDQITLPTPEQFTTNAYYLATLAHELAHATGRDSRLNRPEPRSRNSDAYAIEELTAELSAAFIMGALRIESAPLADHADYLDTYIKILSEQPSIIARVATDAQKAADFILNAITTTQPQTKILEPA